MPSKTQLHGRQAEKIAEHYLCHQGLKKITRNYACRFGEIDLIMQQRDCIIFIEVRMRNNPDFGLGLETVNQKKQQRIRKTAQHYLQQNKLYDTIACRFDIISLLKQQRPTWIKNAF